MSSITAWRLCAAHYATAAFAGEGSRLFGGRWSPVGLAVAYTSESRALAMLEVLANAEDAELVVHVPWTFVPAEFPTHLIEKPTRVPEDWRAFPHAVSAQEFGAAWAREGRSAVLRVPSAVVPGEFNFLLHPAHPDFKHVKLGPAQPFSFDARLGR